MMKVSASAVGYMPTTAGENRGITLSSSSKKCPHASAPMNCTGVSNIGPSQIASGCSASFQIARCSSIVVSCPPNASPIVFFFAVMVVLPYARHDARPTCPLPLRHASVRAVSAQLVFLAIDVATAFAAILLGLRALQRWRLPAAQLIALIAFDTFCDVALGRSDYSYWIPAALQIEVHGPLAVVFNIARNLTPYQFAAFSYIVFTDRRRFPRWLYLLLAIQLFLEVAITWFVDPIAAYADALTQIAPSLLQTVFVVMALYWTVADWRNDLI